MQGKQAYVNRIAAALQVQDEHEKRVFPQAFPAVPWIERIHPQMLQHS
jgi:hypothetical protein